MYIHIYVMYVYIYTYQFIHSIYVYTLKDASEHAPGLVYIFIHICIACICTY